MDLHHLYYVLMLAKEKNFSRAAANLFITQPTLSQQMKKLEDELGFPLVTRTRGGANGSSSILTEKGSHLMNAYDRFSEDLGKTAKVLYGKFFGNLPEANTENR